MLTSSTREKRLRGLGVFSTYVFVSTIYIFSCQCGDVERIYSGLFAAARRDDVPLLTLVLCQILFEKLLK